MQKIVFDSAQLPGNDRLRKEAWIDTLASAVARLNVDPAPDVRFGGRLEIVPLHEGSVSTVAATFGNATRTIADIGVDGRDSVLLMLNAGQSMCRLTQNGRNIDCAPGEAVLYDLAEPSRASVTAATMSRVTSIQLPRSLLRRRLADFEDRFLMPVPAQSGALSLVRAYVDALMSLPGSNDPLLARLAMSHISDLVAATAGQFDAAMAEQSSGQRAARLITIGREIDRGFGDPGFSLTGLSLCLGVTPRQVQRLLAANETSFVDEVMERRLRRARGMLASPRRGHMSIIAIAHECGFSTVSHFHRAFRRRFGMTPGDMRAQSK